MLKVSISFTHSAFIKGHHNLDKTLFANEIVEDFKRRKSKGLVLKLDFEKAYDRVN